jgi:tripartite ATP-independent transporter DctP family solute receptor
VKAAAMIRAHKTVLSGGDKIVSMKSMAVLASSVAVCFAAIAPASAETALKWAHVYEVSEPYHTCAVAASDKLKAATGGRYSVEVFPASSLGKESDINEGLGLGTVDIIYTGQLFAGRSYGPIAIGGAPYMFRDYAHWDKYRNSDLFAELANGYKDATGNHITSMTYYGERHVTSNKPIDKPEDLQGLKIRVPDAPLYMMFPKAAGANPTPIAFAEVYLALQQGTVDAQENPLPTIQAKKFYEVQKHINLTGHITDALLTIVGGPAWNAMDAADQAALETVLDETAVCATEQIIEAEKNLVQWFRDEGVDVREVDRAPFRAATMALHNGPDATWDQATYDKLQSIE